MSTNQTQYYALSQWEPSDKVERTDFNADNAKIDAALRGLSQSLNAKANSSTLSNLSATVSQKADKSALAALERTVAQKSDQPALDILTAQQAADTAALRGENCWVKLREWRLETGAEGVDLDFSDLDKGPYRQLQLHFSLGTTEKTVSLVLTVNRLVGPRYCTSGTSAGTGIHVCHAMSRFAAGTVDWFPPCGCDDMVAGLVRFVSDFVHTPGQTAFSVTNLSWDSLSSLQFAMDGPFSPGSEFALYGLKR